MFTPIILACTMNGCITIGGPAVATEEECHRSVMEVGLAYAMQAYPDHQVVDYQCVAWGTPA